MIYLLDSNILLYSKIEDAPEHAAAFDWLLSAVLDTNNTLIICETSVLAFLRIGTNKRLFDPPLPLAQARSFLDSLFDRPNVRLFQPTSKVYFELIDLMSKHHLAGNATMDAHLATIALRIGATLVTRDRDFARFPYLKILNPIDDPSGL